MNGFFTSFAKKIKNGVISLFENSFFSIICEKISNFYVKNVESGIITNFFTAYDKSDNAYEKISDKAFGLFDILLKPFRFIAAMTKNSKTVCALKSLCSNIFNISVRAFGLFALPWGVIGLTSSVIDYPGAVVCGIYMLLCILGAFCILCNRSISVLVNGSGLCGLFGIELSYVKEYKYSAILFVFTGLLAGVLSVFFGIIPVMAAIILFVAAMLAFYSPYFVTLMFAAVLPFMPTMVMVAGSLAIALCLVVKKVTDQHKCEIKGSVLNLYVLFMCFVYILGTIASVNKASSFKISLVYIAFIISFFVISKVIDSSKKIIYFISAMSLASIPVGLYGIYQKLTGFDNENTWLDSEMFEEIQGRVVSFFDNPNVFGEYIILLFMLCLALVFISERYSLKLVYTAALAVLGASMIFTYSRGCWIGLVIAVCVYLFFVNKKLLGVAVVAGLISLFFLPESIITRIASVGNLSDSSTSYRVFIWNGTVEMLKDFWMTGIGVGSDAFNAIYPRYAYSAITAPHPHNLYLLVLSETGIIGILVLIAVILVLFNKLLHVIKHTENKKLKIIAAAVGSAITGFLVQGMFDNVWYNYRVFLLFWIFVAVGASVYNVYRKEKSN
ncbi:MAG: O-antigen ligase family protein [Clostridia bacterium]|nr:O-antigen ligase family protein [Clostridia bacterium]